MRVANKIIINADDFGYSIPVNRAIVASFERALVTNTSLMANMPGFEDAVGQVRANAFLSGKVGLHFNLTEGYPLTNSILQCSRFCHADGHFIYDRKQPLLYLSSKEKASVYEEISAQLGRLLAAGIMPSHLDSHHHIHTEWAIGRLVVRLAYANGIRKIRLTRNMGEQKGRVKMLHKQVFNRWYLKRIAGITAVDFFGDIHDWQFNELNHPKDGKNIEIMVHPLFDESGDLVDYDLKKLDEQLAPVIDLDNNISYSDL